MPKTSTSPAYRLHKVRGLAVVTIDGKDQYLGKHGTTESHARYARLIAEWEARHKTPQPKSLDLTLNELILRYLRYAGHSLSSPTVTAKTQRLASGILVLGASAAAPAAWRPMRQRRREGRPPFVEPSPRS